MMLFLRCFVLFCLSFAVSEKPPVKPIITLSANPDDSKGEKSLVDYVEDNTNATAVIILYTRPDSKECTDLEAAFQKAAKKLRKWRMLDWGKVDVSAPADSKLESKFKAEAPTIMLFRAGAEVARLPGGGHDAKAIRDWVKKEHGPTVEWVHSQEAFDKLISSRTKEEILVAGYGKEQLGHILNAAALTGFKEMWGRSLRYAFWATNHGAFLGIYRGVKEKADFEPPPGVTVELVKKWIQDSLGAFFGKITQQNMMGLLQNSPKGMVIACFDPNDFDNQVDRYSYMFRKLAKKWKGFGFSYVDMRDSSAYMLNVHCEKFPMLVLKVMHKTHSGEKAYQLRFDSDPRKLTEEAVNDWLKLAMKDKSGEAEFKPASEL